MHPPEAHGPANRSDAAKYERHCFEVLHAEKCATVRDSKSVGGPCTIFPGLFVACQLSFVKKYNAFAVRVGCTTEPNRF